MIMGIDLEKLTLAVCEIARRAGVYIREEGQKFSLESVERKQVHDYFFLSSRKRRFLALMGRASLAALMAARAAFSALRILAAA